MQSPDMQRVKFTGGVMDGAEIELPADVDPSKLRLVITSGGIVYDKDRRRPVPGARIIRRPQDAG